MPRGEGFWVYVVPLKRVYWGRRTNRASRAVRMIRDFVRRHTKADRVVIMNEVNELVWSRSREKPPRRVKILVKVEEKEEEGNKIRVATVRLAGKKLRPGQYVPLKEEKEEKEKEKAGTEEEKAETPQESGAE